MRPIHLLLLGLLIVAAVSMAAAPPVKAAGAGSTGAGGLSHSRPLTISRSFFAALNAGAVEAAMAMLSPVCGFRPWRAGRERVENVPNPAMAMASCLARASVVKRGKLTPYWSGPLGSDRRLEMI